MNKAEKIMAEMEAKMTVFDETINELKQKAQQQTESHEAFQGKHIEEMHTIKKQAANKLKELSDADESHHERLSEELKHFMHDMDLKMREALAYYK